VVRQKEFFWNIKYFIIIFKSLKAKSELEIFETILDLNMKYKKIN
jgi:hypothetical protein